MAASNKRIAKNTVLLYIRMAFAMLVGLYTSHIVLAVLGAQDFDILCQNLPARIKPHKQKKNAPAS